VYDSVQVLRAIDEHTLGVFGFLVISVGGMYLWFIEGLRVSRRDRAYAFPAAVTLFYLAHDTSFVVRVDKWLGYDHWFVYLWWAALVLTSLMELVCLRQVWRYGREELAPTLSPRAFGWALVGAFGCAEVLWSAVKHALGESPAAGDDLFMFSFGATVLFYPPFTIAMMLRRRSSRGQTVLMWVGFGGIGVGYFGASIAYFGPAFRGWEWVTMAIVSVLACVLGGGLVHADRRRGVLGGSPAAAQAPAAAVGRSASS
jgi:hypothetical protein